ncbi:MAG: BACON domain-containing carbohydrate-binding protein [bacterium]|nr:BACON domain-containing carbohydrate-binding protein [bacterium]
MAYDLPRIDYGTGGGSTYLSDVTRLYSSLRTNAIGYNWWQWCDVITTGDFDNDGYDDIVLGNLEYPISSGTWYRYLVYGKAGKEAAWGSDVDVNNNLSVAIPIVANNVAYNKINVGWMSAGDVNGDGCADLLLSTGSTSNYLLFGSTTKWNAQKTIPTDANVTLNLPYKNGSPEQAAWAHIAKDMNEDGISEVVVTGAVFDSGTEPAESYVYLGKSSGWSTVNLATDAQASFLAETGADDSCAAYGWGFLPLISGDFNGDGHGDLFTVLENNSEVKSVAGQAYVVLGKKYVLTSNELLVKDPTENSTSFYIKNVSIDGQSIDWTASEDVSWISSISPTSGTGLAYNNYAQITVNIDRTGLNNGVYTGYVTVTSGDRSEDVKVVLMIGRNPQPPIVKVTPEHVEIGADTTTGTFQVSNVGEGSLSWSVTESEPWITGLSPTSGSISGSQVTDVTVTVDHTGYTADQTGKITLTYNNGVVKDLYVTMKGSDLFFFDSFEDATLDPFSTGGDSNWFVTSVTASSGTYSAQAGDINDYQQTYMTINRVVPAGGGTISFTRQVSSEYGWDYLLFYIDNDLYAYWSGEVPWEKVAYFVSAGAHNFTWIYYKDSSVSSGSDTAWVDNVKIQKYPTFFNGFESGVLAPFTTSGNADWTVTTSNPFSGTYCAQSGDISDNQQSDLMLTRNITTGGEAIKFAFKVSSEYYWDYLRFYIDDI